MEGLVRRLDLLTCVGRGDVIVAQNGVRRSLEKAAVSVDDVHYFCVSAGCG